MIVSDTQTFADSGFTSYGARMPVRYGGVATDQLPVNVPVYGFTSAATAPRWSMPVAATGTSSAG